MIRLALATLLAVPGTDYHAVTPIVVPVVVPAYGAAYTPPPQQLAAGGTPAGDDETKQLLRDILAELKKLNAGDAADEKAPPGPADAVAVLNARCASCHAATVAKDKGGDFTLIDSGKVVELSLNEKKRIVSKVTDGTMPPKGAAPLAPVDKQTVADYFKK